jgi:hypothetical protein
MLAVLLQVILFVDALVAVQVKFATAGVSASMASW